MPNNSTLRQGSTILKVSADRNTQDTNSTEDDLDIDPEVVAKERARLAKSATHFARSTKIDRANVRDPPDFEPDWLFPYPDCFASDEPTDTYEEIQEQTRKTVENLRQMLKDFEEPAYKVFELGIDKYYSTEAGKEGFTFPESVRPWRATVDDVGQASHSRMPDSFSGYSMAIRLLSKRTLKLAKKRLTIIDSCQPEQALLLYLGSAESEKLSTAGFLTRHNMREDFVKDHAHKEVNLWTTELHLSFYKKRIITSDQSRSMPALEESIFESPAKLSAFPGKSKSSLDKIQKGAIGWRFSGDLHDRRWTGTILAFVPGREDTNWIESSDLTSDKGFHGQRKIIEARLFAEMTKTIHVSTREVLKDLDAVLDGGEGAIYKGSSEYHDPFSESFDQSYSRSKLYLQLSDFLSHLDDSFKSTMETIEAYMDREQQRLVQPRWSVGDERQHRPELQKWDREGKKNVALLRSVRNEVGTKMSRVKHLRESLNADMQLREARLQARSAEDVRLFTYVTIVFLPISFSSSLFSMSKAPDDSLVGTFAKVAVIALIITLVILFNLKTMSRNMWTYVNAGLHKISDTMSISSWKFWKDTHEELVQAEKRNIQSDEPLQIRKMSKWWYCLFFLAFVLSELPALRVQSAWDVVSPPTEEDPNQLGLFRKILVVILGLLFLPLFVFVYTILFILRNFIDLFRLYNEISIQGSKRPTDRPEDSKKLKINNVEYKDDNVTSDRKKVEEANWTSDAGQKEEYIARIARLTHPPRLYISSATANDKLDKGDKGQDKDQDSEVEADEVEGEKDHAMRTKIRTVRVLDRIRWKEPDIESNAERRIRVGHGVAVD